MCNIFMITPLLIVYYNNIKYLESQFNLLNANANVENKYIDRLKCLQIYYNTYNAGSFIDTFYLREKKT